MIKKKNKNQKLYRMMGVVFIIAFSVMVINGILKQPQISENKKIIAELDSKIEYEKTRIAEVEELKTKVETDEYIEKVAREKLGMVKRDELIFMDVSGE